MKTGVFIERDGVLVKARVQRQQQISPLSLEDFAIVKSAVPLLRRLRDAGMVVIVTTNQPGLSRGYQSRRVLDLMHKRLRDELVVDDILVCPHDETDCCLCRKPKPGLLTEGAFKWQIALDHSFVISDKWQDAQAAHAAGCTSLLVESPWLSGGHHDLVLPNLKAAVEKLLTIHERPLRVVAG